MPSDGFVSSNFNRTFLFMEKYDKSKKNTRHIHIHKQHFNLKFSHRLIPDLIFLTLFVLSTKYLLYFESIIYLCPNSAATTSFFLCFHEQKNKLVPMSFDIVLYSIERLLQKWKRIKLKLLYEQVYVECSTTDVSFHDRNNNNAMSFSECKEHCGKTVELRKTVNISGGNQCTLQRWTS